MKISHKGQLLLMKYMMSQGYISDSNDVKYGYEHISAVELEIVCDKIQIIAVLPIVM